MTVEIVWTPEGRQILPAHSTLTAAQFDWMLGRYGLADLWDAVDAHITAGIAEAGDPAAADALRIKRGVIRGQTRQPFYRFEAAMEMVALFSGEIAEVDPLGTYDLSETTMAARWAEAAAQEI